MNDLQLTWHISKFPVRSQTHFIKSCLLTGQRNTDTTKKIFCTGSMIDKDVLIKHLISLKPIFKPKPGGIAIFYICARWIKSWLSGNIFPFSFDFTCTILLQILTTHLSIPTKPKCWDCLREDNIISMSVCFSSNFAQMVMAYQQLSTWLYLHF